MRLTISSIASANSNSRRCGKPFTNLLTTTAGIWGRGLRLHRPRQINLKHRSLFCFRIARWSMSENAGSDTLKDWSKSWIVKSVRVSNEWRRRAGSNTSAPMSRKGMVNFLKAGLVPQGASPKAVMSCEYRGSVLSDGRVHLPISSSCSLRVLIDFLRNLEVASSMEKEKILKVCKDVISIHSPPGPPWWSVSLKQLSCRSAPFRVRLRRVDAEFRSRRRRRSGDK